MKTLNKMLLLLLVSIGMSANAQKVDDPPSLGTFTGTITSGAATFEYTSFGADAPTVNFLGAGAGDQLFEYGWFFRVAGDAQEFVFDDPDLGDYVGDTVTLTWNDVGGRGLFSAVEVDVINEVAAGQATFSSIMTITNTSGSPLTITVFNYADIDVAGVFGDDSAVISNSPDFITIDSAGGETVEYRAGGNDFYGVAPFGSRPENDLLDADLDDFANTGLPFGPDDFTGVFQWLDIEIPDGESLILETSIGANTAANVPAAPIVTGGPTGDPIQVPTLNTYMLILLCLVLAAVAFVTLRRQRVS